jgi:hypothetical protein
MVKFFVMPSEGENNVCNSTRLVGCPHAEATPKKKRRM